MSTVVTLQNALAQSQTRFNAAIAGLDPSVLEKDPAVGVWPASVARKSAKQANTPKCRLIWSPSRLHYMGRLA